MEGRVKRKWMLFKDFKVLEIEGILERLVFLFYFRLVMILKNSRFIWFNLILRGV